MQYEEALQWLPPIELPMAEPFLENGDKDLPDAELSCLCHEGGVKFRVYLMGKAVNHDTSAKITPIQFRDIGHLSKQT